MRIGELSKRSGFSRDTIRYYERQGLLPATRRYAESKYKDYGPSAFERLLQVKRLKHIGFSLREVRRLIDPQAKPACSGLPLELQKKLAAIDARMATLASHKALLLRMQDACDGDCDSRSGLPDCVPDEPCAAPTQACR